MLARSRRGTAKRPSALAERIGEGLRQTFKAGGVRMDRALQHRHRARTRAQRLGRGSAALRRRRAVRRQGHPRHLRALRPGLRHPLGRPARAASRSAPRPGRPERRPGHRRLPAAARPELRQRGRRRVPGALAPPASWATCRPDVFIPLAESTSLIERVTRRVMEQTAGPARPLGGRRAGARRRGQPVGAPPRRPGAARDRRRPAVEVRHRAGAARSSR